MNPAEWEKDLFQREDFRQGVRMLGSRGLTYESWHYHYQNKDYIQLAKAVPDTVIILDHFGTPLGVGSYMGKREEIFREWKKDMVELAKCDNVVAKLGGLVMPINGFGFHKKDRPASSDELVAATGDYYRYMLDAFGPDRCMFESNFPVDKQSCSYHVLWNAFKKMVIDGSESDKNSLFHDTAVRTYRLS